MLAVWLVFLIWAWSTAWATPNPLTPQETKYFRHPVSTADHSKFEVLKKEFRTPQEVTKACLSCHNKAGEQVKKTLHFTWTWKGKDGRTLGKAHVINNF